MVDSEIKSEKSYFSGTVRTLKEEDLTQLKPILDIWIKDRETGQRLPDEVEEDLQLMRESINGGNDRNYLVAEKNGKVIGMIGFKNPDKRMIPFSRTSNPTELVNAYVDPELRKGRGVGKALVAKLEGDAGKKGFTEVILNSGPRYKDTGWGFYDKLPGYERVGVAEKYYGEGGDAPVWSKVLS